MIRLRDFVPFFFILRTFVIKATILVFGLFTILWLSGGIYGSFYYAYMPQQTYLLPVDFTFDPCPLDIDKDRCSFLKANVDFQLDQFENYLIAGQTYSISLELALPADDINRNVGMFISCISLENINGNVGPQVCKSSVLPYRTDLHRNIWSIIPFSKSGGEESLSFEFFSDFKDDTHAPVAKAHLEIRSRSLGLSKAYLRIHSPFSGLRYLMYHYPYVSGVVGVLFISIFLFSMVFLLLGKMLDPVHISDHTEESKRGKSKKEVLQKLEKCASFSKLARKVSCEKANISNMAGFEELVETTDDEDDKQPRRVASFDLHED